MTSTRFRCCLSAVLCSVLITPLVAADGRLREHVVDWPGLLTGPASPVDPSGEHGPKRVAGYFSLDRTVSAEMFYFFFESRGSPSDDPVVLWMTGGPGCSSELAVFYENGPFHINDDLTLSENANGWDVGHNVIFVDQPIGTGFSYSDSPDDSVYDEHGVAADMLDFITEFLKAHPHLADNDFFVTGESYAGHYVPAVAHRVWQYNKDNEGVANSTKINLKGLAIGNGLTDPAIQYAKYGDYALQNGLISQTVYDRMHAAMPACKVLIDTCNAHSWDMECQAAVAFCQTAIFGQVLMAAGGVNVYDIRKQCEGPLCYDFSKLGRYLAQESVRTALGVGERKFTECDPIVHAHMMGDWMKNYDTVLPAMLNDGVRAVIYAGDKDLICNYVGNRAWVDALEWDDADKWAAAEDFEWATRGTKAGKVRSVGPLSFVQVYDAGHMVPMDQPVHALDMLTRFTSDKGFKDSTADSLWRRVAAVAKLAQPRLESLVERA